MIAWSVYTTRRLLYPERRAIPPPSPLPDHLVWTFTAPDGATFEIWALEVPSPRARILLYHGYFANRFQVLPLAAALRERGYDVLLPELRGHGARPGPFTFGVKETEEAGVILRWCAQRDGVGRAVPVAIAGFSSGAMVACQIAQRYPQQVHAMVADSLFPRFFDLLAQRLREDHGVPRWPFAWLSWWSLQLALQTRLGAREPVAIASSMSQPLLAIHGGQDRWISREAVLRWFDRWAGPKQQWVEPETAHVQMFHHHPEEYVRRVTAFLSQALPA
ncbi:MAG: alpha/beta fold hydrolase [Candidatus Omnitrophica bacterium]|nr:alpha/beta fold hydrolase [Candidatus Omnitrophota bacterium]